ncbi:MAG TPA: class I SAM-dependent methyltransferase [Actinomycetota bacterium]|nr:class I SAM-dependent methyltransferase [Actinomycetota bacterium]
MSSPQSRWGLRVLGRLDLRGDETVLEAGCGTGRDTARLLDMLPRGRVIALDGSSQMLDRLKYRLAGRLEQVEILRADLSRPLQLDSPVDVVFSVAAFHWVQDHDALFRNLAGVMRPGGRLAADCGGRGNISNVGAAIQQVTGAPAETGIWNFAGAGETRRRLASAGFSDIEVQLHSEPVSFESRREFNRFLETVILGSHLVRMDSSERDAFVASVAMLLPERQVDYVRLTLTAVK